MSRDVPEGWEIAQVGNIAEVRTGGTPSRSNASYWDGDIEWMASGEIHQRYVFQTAEKITALALQESNARILPIGSVMVALNGQGKTRGKAAILRREMACNQSLAAIIPQEPNIPDYFLFLFESMYSHLRNLTGDDARNGLNLGILRSLTVVLPPPDEQRRIAEVLSSVDDAIASIQAVIEQTKKVKQATLERLLTKGIGHTRFKQTEIGEIPESWETASLEQLLVNTPTPMRSGPFGSALKSEELVKVGIPFLGIDNIHVERFVPSFSRFISKEKFRQLKRFAVNPKDVVITIMGTVGRCCVIPLDIGAAISSKHIWAMSFDNDKYVPELACWQLNYAPWIIDKFRMSAQGGIMSAINSGILKKLLFPVPSQSEQQQIFEIWQSFQTEIYIEETKLGNLVKLKSALMSDLLTGRKRVTDTLPLAAE